MHDLEHRGRNLLFSNSKGKLIQMIITTTMRACKVASVMSNSVTLWTVAHQAPLSMGFSRQEYWSGLPYAPPEDLLDPGIELISLMFPMLAGGFFTTSTTWEAQPPQSVNITQSCLTLQLRGLYPARLLCPWNSPGQKTGVASHSLLQEPPQYLTITCIVTSLCIPRLHV